MHLRVLLLLWGILIRFLTLCRRNVGKRETSRIEGDRPIPQTRGGLPNCAQLGCGDRHLSRKNSSPRSNSFWGPTRPKKEKTGAEKTKEEDSSGGVRRRRRRQSHRGWSYHQEKKGNHLHTTCTSNTNTAFTSNSVGPSNTTGRRAHSDRE